ncbi:MAG TPA: response regulator [Longimicrobiales bacterium]|nr:response regulator [Longimicrobiales bacterium]
MMISRKRYGAVHRQRHRTGSVQPAGRPLVLMVEDNADDRSIYGTVLERRGFDVVFADDYDSGMRAARERRPDAVLLDLGLPGAKTGLDLCFDMRRWHETAELPVIVLSGFRANRVSAAAHAAGCTTYMEKPTSPLAVAAELERLLTS